MPAALDDFVVEFMVQVKDFHDMMSSRPELEKCKSVSLRILGQQVRNHGASISDTITILKASTQAEQRQTSRSFLPEIKKEMTKAYDHCAAEKGEIRHNPYITM